MSNRAEEAAWNWAEKNKLDPYSMGRAYGEGYEQAEKDIISLIDSRIAEILGDAQPKPILRMELQNLIDKINEEE